MSLVLNTNIDSLIAQNSLTTSGNQLTTALEQLSSGLQINTAADNAAGYAISQGMTSQINGLDQASQNANDGVSLTQTAQGALTEITNDLQTMRDLAVQSLNGTNSSQDRVDLNQQFQQLSDDINQVASTASFNGVMLLDGTFQGQTFQIGANAGQTITVSSVASVATSNLGQLYTAAATDPAAYTSNGTGAGTAVANGDSGTFSVTIGTGATAHTYTSAAVTLTGDQATDLATAAAAITQATGNAGVVATVDSTGHGINLSSTTQQTVTVNYSATTGAESLATFGLNASSNLSAAQNYAASGSAVSGDTLSSGSSYVATGATTGTDTLTATDTGTYSVTINGNKYTTANMAAGTFNGTAAHDLGAFASALNANTSFTSAGYTASVSGGNLVVTGGKSPFSVSAANFTPGSGTDNLNAGLTGVTATGTPADTGTVAVTIGGNTYTTSTISGFDGNPYNDATLVANALNQSTTVDGADNSLASEGYKVSVGANNQLVVTGGTSAFTVTTAAYTSVTGSNSINLGLTGTAASGESAASTSTLATASVTTIDSSNTVLIQIDAALQQLATTGAQLGAYQNRFQASITGLQTDATNLSSAKSQIVDTDYAQSTSNLSKAQILQQASTAMVAQANTIPQNILTLLQKLP